MESEKLVDQKVEHELQRVDVEEHDEQQRAIQDDGHHVLKTVTAKEKVLVIPDLEQEGEADGEGGEALHCRQELREGFRHFQRYDQERDREPEHGVAESFDP